VSDHAQLDSGPDRQSRLELEDLAGVIDLVDIEDGVLRHVLEGGHEGSQLRQDVLGSRHVMKASPSAQGFNFGEGS
jgi:hypothetical protein